MATSLNAADPKYTSAIQSGTIATAAEPVEEVAAGNMLFASMIMAIFAAVFAF